MRLPSKLMKHGREHARGRGDFRLAGIGEQKAAGAVGRLQHAWEKAGLPVGGSLLIAGDASDRDRRAEMLGFGHTEIVLAVAKLRQNFARDGEAVEKPVVPCARPDVVEHGAGGVARFDRMHLAAGQLEQEKAVDRAEAHLASARPLLKSGHIGQQPGELGRREIRIDRRARRLFDMRAPALAVQLIAMLRGAPVLPHDGIGERLAGGALPHDRRLALIGDADRCDRLRANVLERGAPRLEHRLPDLLGIVLDFARSGIDLGQRNLRRVRKAVPLHRRQWRGCSSSPDRWRGQTFARS